MAAAEDEDSVLNNQSPSLLGGVQAAKLMTIGAVEAALISMICSAQKPLRCSRASILYCLRMERGTVINRPAQRRGTHTQGGGQTSTLWVARGSRGSNR